MTATSFFIAFIFGAMVALLVVGSTGANVRYHFNKLGHPGWGACKRCGVTWDVAESHQTRYRGCPRPDGTRGAGCFPLCEKCWHELRSPAHRLTYYKQLVEEWGEGREDDWPVIQEAVLNGE